MKRAALLLFLLCRLTEALSQSTSPAPPAPSPNASQEQRSECVNAETRVLDFDLRLTEGISEGHAKLTPINDRSTLLHTWENISGGSPEGNIDAERSLSIGRISIVYQEEVPPHRTCLTACTGSLINGNRILTAYHCFSASQRARKPDRFVVKRALIRFGYLDDTRESADPNDYFDLATQPDEKLSIRDLDIAVVPLTGSRKPQTPYRPLRISKDGLSPSDGDEQLFLLGYPAGAPLVRTVSFPPYYSGTPGFYNSVYHSIPAVGGLSGAPIFSTRSATAVGIHLRGSKNPDNPNESPLEFRTVRSAGVLFSTAIATSKSAWSDKTIGFVTGHKGLSLDPPATSTPTGLRPNDLDQWLNHFRLTQRLPQGRDFLGKTARYERREANIRDLVLESQLLNEPFELRHRYRFSTLIGTQMRHVTVAASPELAAEKCEALFYGLYEEFRRRLSDEATKLKVVRTPESPTRCIASSRDTAPLSGRVRFDDLYRVNRPDIADDIETNPVIESEKMTVYACNNGGQRFFLTLDAQGVASSNRCSVEVTTFEPWTEVPKP